MRTGRVELEKSPIPSDMLDRAETLTELLGTLARSFPDYACLRLGPRDFSDEQLTVGAVWTRAREIQSALMRQGLRPGGFVVIVMPTGAELVATYFGVMLAGGVPALAATPSHRLADPLTYVSRVGRIVQNAEAHALYGDNEAAGIFRAHAEALPSTTAILTPADTVAAPLAEP